MAITLQVYINYSNYLDISYDIRQVQSNGIIVDIGHYTPLEFIIYPENTTWKNNQKTISKPYAQHTRPAS